jgi:radical SAM protein with 4Fe4S-binding SPASM domain
MTYQEENNKLAESFFEHSFGKGYRNPEAKECENFQSLEIFFNNKCNLSCKYCYLQRFDEGLYPKDLQDGEKLIKNLQLFLDWMDTKDYVPKHVELFSGEVFIQEAGWKAIDTILNHYENKKRKPEFLIVPTNFTFILSPDLTRRVEDMLTRSQDIGLPIGLSSSFDGKYCEANRPFKSGKEIRDDDYYDKVFQFAKKWGTGFHPMVYSEHIEDWEKNWLWFQENFTKHKLSWKNIYLLEVRNVEWTNKQIQDFGKFVEFLIKWTFKYPCRGDVGIFLDFLFNGGFNILRNPLTSIGRGIGCSIQSAVALRLGDLTWVPCHRTSYSPFNFGHFKVENDKITSFEAKNVDMLTAMYSFDASTQPWCEQCLLKSLCSFGCLGSQLEVTGDPFTPIPTVCELQHVKVGAMIKAYRELGILDEVLVKVNQTKTDAIREMEKMLYPSKESNL